MGQSYKIVNVDKKEVIEPCSGSKLMEWSYSYADMVQSFIHLLLNDWKYDRCFVVGDYAISSDIDEEPIYSVLENLEKELNIYQNFFGEYSCTIYNLADENSDYVKLSNDIPKFKEIEKVTIPLDDAVVNGYFYNHKQKVFVDLSHCPTQWYFSDKKNKKAYRNCISPISLLLTLGNGMGSGDFRNENQDYLIGFWTEDMLENGENIEFSITPLDNTSDYEEFIPNFVEENETLVLWDDEETNKKMIADMFEQNKRFDQMQKERRKTIHISKKPDWFSAMYAYSEDYSNTKQLTICRFCIFDKNSNTIIHSFENFQDIHETKIYPNLIFKNNNALSVQRNLDFGKNKIFFMKEKSLSYLSKDEYICYISNELMNLKFVQSSLTGTRITNFYEVNGDFEIDNNEEPIYVCEYFSDYSLSINDLVYEYRRVLDDLKTASHDEFESLIHQSKELHSKIVEKEKELKNLQDNWNSSICYSPEKE